MHRLEAIAGQQFARTAREGPDEFNDAEDGGQVAVCARQSLCERKWRIASFPLPRHSCLGRSALRELSSCREPFVDNPLANGSFAGDERFPTHTTEKLPADPQA